MASSNIDQEITRIENNISDSFDAIELYGVSVLSTDTSDNLATRILEIETKIPLSDWNQTDDTKKDYIKNKPNVLTDEDGEVIDASLTNLNDRLKDISDSIIDNYLPLSAGYTKPLTDVLYMTNNKAIKWFDASNSEMTILNADSTNTVSLGYGSAGKGYTTYIYGNNIGLSYGTSRTIGAYLNSSGNLGIGTTQPNLKLDVRGSGIFKTSQFPGLIIERTNGPAAASIEFKNAEYWNGSGVRSLGFIGMTGDPNSGLKRWTANSSTTYTIYDSGNFVSGTGANNWAAGNHTHDYLPLTGGDLTGPVTLTNNSVSTGLYINETKTTNSSGNPLTGSNFGNIGLLVSALGFNTAGYFNSVSGIGVYSIISGTSNSTNTYANKAIYGNVNNNVNAYSGYFLGGKFAVASSNTISIKYINGSTNKGINITPSETTITGGNSTIILDSGAIILMPGNTTSGLMCITTSGVTTSQQITSGNHYINSDKRLKNIIDTPSYSIEDIAKLSVIKYKWNDNRDDKIHLGSIAQDVQKIIPELVSEDSNGNLSLDYATLGTISSIELAKEIVKLKEEIKQLKEKYGQSSN